MRDIYIGTQTQNSAAVSKAPSLKHLLNDHGDHPNVHENSHKLYNEMENLILSLKKLQWKLTKKHDQDFPTEGKVL